MKALVVYRHYHIVGANEVTFYIGQGFPSREKSFAGRSYEWCAYVDRECGGRDSVKVEVLHFAISKASALILENYCIKRYGLQKNGGSLVNRNLGCDGKASAATVTAALEDSAMLKRDRYLLSMGRSVIPRRSFPSQAMGIYFLRQNVSVTI